MPVRRSLKCKSLFNLEMISIFSISIISLIDRCLIVRAAYIAVPPDNLCSRVLLTVAFRQTQCFRRSMKDKFAGRTKEAAEHHRPIAPVCSRHFSTLALPLPAMDVSSEGALRDHYQNPALSLALHADRLSSKFVAFRILTSTTIPLHSSPALGFAYICCHGYYNIRPE